MACLQTPTRTSQLIRYSPAKTPDESHSLSTTDFVEQIKQLELEGNRLLEAANCLSDSLQSRKTAKFSPDKGISSSALLSAASVSALADISAEQRTVDQIRSQLYAKSRDTELLTQKLLRSHGAPSLGYRYPSTGSLLDKLDFDITPTSNSNWQRTGSSTFISNSQGLPLNTVEQQLKNANNEIAELRSRLEEVVTISDKQKNHFRAAVEDLRQQLHATVTSKDILLRAKEKEFAEQEFMMCKLQRNIDQLELANRTQEKTLLELNERLQCEQREKQLIESIVNEMKGQLLDQERKRGHVLANTDRPSVLDQDVPTLLRTVDWCIQELDLDVEVNKEKVRELETKLTQEKEQFCDKERHLLKRQEDRISELSAEHEKTLAALNEQCLSANKKIHDLEEQLALQREKFDDELKSKSLSLSEVERQLNTISQQRDEELKQWNDKKLILEQAREEAQLRLVEMQTDHEVKIHEAIATESRFTNLQAELKRKLDEIGELERDKSELLAREQANQLADRNRQLALAEVQSALDASRHEIQVVGADHGSRINPASRVQALSIQLTALSEKCHRLSTELELSRSQYSSIHERFADLKVSHESMVSQLNAAVQARDQLSVALTDRAAEVGRLSQTNDAILADLNSLRAQREKLTIQLEERERNFLAAKEQCDRMAAAFNSYVEKEVSFRREKQDMEIQLSERGLQLKEIKSEKTLLRQRLKYEEEHCKNLEENSKKFSTELINKNSELDAVVCVKEKLSAELRETKCELNRLKDQVNRLQHLLEQREGNLGHEVNSLSQKLKTSEHELRLARKALNTHDEVDVTAAQVAGKMQREVTEKRSCIDSLQSRIHQLEDSLDAMSKEKKLVESNMKSLEDVVKRFTEQKERLILEVNQLTNRSSHQQTQIQRLQIALEKAALQHTTAQSLAEQNSQEIARLKLKHQLELKELERTEQIVRSQYTPADVNPSSLVDADHVTTHPFVPTLPSTAAVMPLPLNSMASSTSTVPLTSWTWSTPSATVPSHTFLSSVPSVPPHTLVCTISSGIPPMQSSSCVTSVPCLSYEFGDQLTSHVNSHLGSNSSYTRDNVGTDLLQLMQEMKNMMSVPKDPPSTIQYSQHRYNSDVVDYSSLSPSECSSSRDFTEVANWRHEVPVRDKKSDTVKLTVYDLITGRSSPSSGTTAEPEADTVCSEAVVIQKSHCTKTGYTRSKRHRKIHRPETSTLSYDTHTKALCQQLEKKIENLTQIGNSLQVENTEIAKSMKDHGKKLSKIKIQFKN